MNPVINSPALKINLIISVTSAAVSPAALCRWIQISRSQTVINFNEQTQEFIAKIYCDLGKNIVSIGVASYFFKGMPLFFRISFGILGVAFILTSIYTYARKGGQ